MTRSAAGYTPINCEFHDVLESAATRRVAVVLGFTDEAGIAQQRHARIVDLIAHDGVEHLELDSGERIRLDRLVEVDGQRLADYPLAG